MDETQRSVLEAFLNLYKQQMEHFQHTQQIEWKANFGLWTLLAGAIYIVSKEVVPIPHCGWPMALVLALLIAAVHALWLLNVHSSENDDKRFWTRYRGEALQLLRGGIDRLQGDEREWGGKQNFTWLALEVLVTLFLCGFLLLSLSTKSAAEHQYVVERVRA